MVRLRNNMSFKSRSGKIAANVRAAFGVMLDPPVFDVEYDIDGRQERRKVSTINVSNNAFGENGLLYADDVTGGHLGFYTSRRSARAAWPSSPSTSCAGRLKDNEDVTEMTGTAIDLHFPRVDRKINCVIDGELLPMGRDVSLRLHPANSRSSCRSRRRRRSLWREAGGGRRRA